MSKDYKPEPQKQSNNKGNPFWAGLLIGLLLGVGITVAVAIKITGGENPLSNQIEQRPVIPAVKKAEIPPQESDALPKDESPVATQTEENNKHFDFYNILPDTGKTTKPIPEETKKNSPDTQSAQYYLQIGAFQNEQDADNMKAKLALQGFEALVQTAAIPEKGTWHRVRIGPFSTAEQTNKTKEDLSNNGFKAETVEIKTSTE